MNPVHVVTLRQLGITALTVRQGQSRVSLWVSAPTSGQGLKPNILTSARNTTRHPRLLGEVRILRIKHNEELIRSDERIGGVNINSLFVNIYYDLPVSGQLRPYIGGGVGFGMAEVEFDTVWARNTNPDAITTADDAVYKGSGDADTAREDFHKRLAGTSSTASHTLEDTVFGYQAVVGVDYMLTESASIGVKGRWVRYAKFSDSNEWTSCAVTPQTMAQERIRLSIRLKPTT